VHFDALCRDLSKDFLIKRPLRRCTSFPNIEINVSSCYSFIVLSNLSKCTVLLDVEGGGGKVQKWESYSTRVIRWSQAIQGGRTQKLGPSVSRAKNPLRVSDT
jgi:hypothetical protein